MSVFISLGSNVGDRAGNLLLGIRGMMEASLEVTRMSRIYETEPVEMFSQPTFLNMVVGLGSHHLLEPEQLLGRLLRIEYSLGRTREVPKGPRTIDLDLLLFGSKTSETEFLQLPHPRLHLRKFVLVPLAEIAGNVVHPTLNKSVSQLLAEVNDLGAVELWKPAEAKSP